MKTGTRAYYKVIHEFDSKSHIYQRRIEEGRRK